MHCTRITYIVRVHTAAAAATARFDRILSRLLVRGSFSFATFRSSLHAAAAGLAANKSPPRRRRQSSSVFPAPTPVAARPPDRTTDVSVRRARLSRPRSLHPARLGYAAPCRLLFISSVFSPLGPWRFFGPRAPDDGTLRSAGEPGQGVTVGRHGVGRVRAGGRAAGPTDCSFDASNGRNFLRLTPGVARERVSPPPRCRHRTARPPSVDRRRDSTAAG